MKKAVLFLSWLVVGAACAGEIIIVDDGGYGDFDNIQAAIDYSYDGDIIYVLPGTYTGPGNRDIDYGGRAITVTGVDPQDPYIVAATVIDCNGQGRGFHFHDGEEANSVLAGLTITNGFADYGAGIRSNDSSPTITNCIISNSTATAHGGGMYLCPPPYPYVSHTVANCEITGNEAVYGGGVYLSDGTLSNCTITENTASCSGGGVYCVDGKVTDCLIQGNTALGEYGLERAGGGVCLSGSGTVSECVIRGNSADFGYGGGVDCISYLGGMVKNCEISHNSAAYGGGVSWCHLVANCVIAGNTANFFRDGGGLYCCYKVINCLISGNVAGDMGGGLYSFQLVSHIIDCTFSGNVAVHGGGVACSDGVATGLVLTNTIVWGNRSNWPDANEVDLGRGHFISANYNCIKDGSWVEGVGNIVDNPTFVREPNDGGDGWGDDPATPDVNEGANDDYGDLHLAAGSPCINTGDPCLYAGLSHGDIDGQPRIMGFRVDMGADEFVIPMIAVTKPQGGETWVSGSWHKITWYSEADLGAVDIWLSTRNGKSWQLIEWNVSNTGSYMWHIPHLADGSDCAILVLPSEPDPDVICIESGL
ncbi:MAG: right-handed parallel beta-helix repeat-containing protein, partial [Planctomycetota bacterium]